MKWASIVALLLGVVLRSPSYQTLLQFVVCAGAILVVGQAARAAKYFWAAGFSAIAVLYNPIVPTALSHNLFLILVCLTLFALSLAVLKTKPVLSPLLLATKSMGNRSSRLASVSWSVSRS